LGGESFVVNGGFGDIEQGIDKRSFTGMFIAENEERSVGELFL
jgi:hypothetical protein